MHWIERCTILKTVWGSRAFGTAGPNSDLDVRGVCIPPARYLLGLSGFEQYEDRTGEVVIYGLAKFARLALANNPNMLDILWAATKDALLKQLIADHEPGYAPQWQAMAPGLARQLLAGIVAFELRVDDWQCKLKLNQHRPESHAALHATYAQGGAPQQALAGWMERLGLARGASGRPGA